MLYYHFGLFIPRAQELTAARGLGNGYSFGNDFYQVWVTCRKCLRHGCDLYSSAMTQEIQIGLYGRTLDRQNADDFVDQRAFPYPAFTDLLFWPAAELPFPVMRVLVLFLFAAMTVASVLLWIRALAWHPGWVWTSVILLLTLCSYPVLEGLYAGQIGLLVGFLLATAIFLVQRSRLLLAGILTGLTTIKPQVTLLVIFYLFVWSLRDWRARWRFCVGLLATMLLLVGASLAVWPHWIESWTNTLVAYHRYTTPILINEVLASQLRQRASGPVTLLIVAGLMAAAAWLAWRHRAAAADSMEFWLTLSLLLSITAITLLPGQAVYDHVILLPGILVLARHAARLRASWVLTAVAALGAGILLWPWFAAFGLILLRLLTTSKELYSNAALSLPLRTAAAFPFVVLALLVLVHRSHMAKQAGDQSLPC